jgi:hypothetical protein
MPTVVSVSPMASSSPSAAHAASPTKPPSAAASPDPGFARLVERPLEHALTEHAAFEDTMRAASSGAFASERDLLVLQAQVYRYSQHVEVTTRVVDRAAGSLKQLLNTSF